MVMEVGQHSDAVGCSSAGGVVPKCRRWRHYIIVEIRSLAIGVDHAKSDEGVRESNVPGLKNRVTVSRSSMRAKRTRSGPISSATVKRAVVLSQGLPSGGV